MRKKYIRPSVELVRHISETPILAGSPGAGSSGTGSEGEQGVGEEAVERRLVKPEPNITNSPLGKTGMSINP